MTLRWHLKWKLCFRSLNWSKFTFPLQNWARFNTKTFLWSILFLKRYWNRQVAMVQWLVCWAHTLAIWVRFLACDLLTKCDMMFLRHFCTSLHVGHVKRSRGVSNYRTTSGPLEAQIWLLLLNNISTYNINQNNWTIFIKTLHCVLPDGPYLKLPHHCTILGQDT